VSIPPVRVFPDSPQNPLVTNITNTTAEITFTWAAPPGYTLETSPANCTVTDGFTSLSTSGLTNSKVDLT
jgi:hypothetical protein